MAKVQNVSKKNRKLALGVGIIEFDENGIAEIPDEAVKGILALKGFSVVGGGNVPEPPKKDEPDKKVKSDDNRHTEGNSGQNTDIQEGASESKFDFDDLNLKNVAQLRKIAKDNDIDLGMAKTKDDIIDILMKA